MGQKKKNIIPETTLVATQVHVAESEARPEETHASFKAVLPNLRHGCALGETLRRRKRTPHRWARRNTIRAVFERDHRRPQDHLQKEATGLRPCNELPLLLRPRACNELQLLLRHRAVRKNTHAGEVRLRFEAITCNEFPLHAMNYSCCCAIVRSEKTHTLATTYPATNYRS